MIAARTAAPPPRRIIGPTPPKLPGSVVHAMLIELCARLRLACEAIGVEPGDAVRPSAVRLEDLSDAERTRLMVAGQRDLWDLINGGGAP